MICDLLAALLMLLGALLCLGAAVSLIRFPDVISKLHAITKPQVLGMICIALGVALGIRTPTAISFSVLTVTFQLLTSPVSAHMVARSAYRSGIVPKKYLDIDELAEDLEDFRKKEDSINT